MPYPLRRKGQELPLEEAYSLLEQECFGVLSLIDSDGLPYGVPVNYASDNGSLYFHGAPEGRKADAVRNGTVASFCVVGTNVPLPEKFATTYQSVIAEGPLRVVNDPAEIHSALMAIARTSGRDEEACIAEIDACTNRCMLIALDIKTLSGKESLDLMKARRSTHAKGVAEK